MFSVISNILKRLGSFLVCTECVREGQSRKKGTTCAKVERLEMVSSYLIVLAYFERLTIWISIHVTLFYPPYIPMNRVM